VVLPALGACLREAIRTDAHLDLNDSQGIAAGTLANDTCGSIGWPRARTEKLG